MLPECHGIGERSCRVMQDPFVTTCEIFLIILIAIGYIDAGSAAKAAPAAVTALRKDLVMAEPKFTPNVRVAEIRALADCLEARGASVLMKGQPAQCAAPKEGSGTSVQVRDFGGWQPIS